MQTFYKYHGTGNDFILIDNRQFAFDASNSELIKKLCDRRFGIGADGIMLLQNKPEFDFEMLYFNADGKAGTMCGNGGRCIVEFAKTRNIINDKAHFFASDGEHIALINQGIVSLRMNDVLDLEMNSEYSVLNTGSPHYVVFVNDLEKYDVVYFGKKIRNSERFVKEGINVNFVEKNKNELFVRTYERGVENETYSCGTGVTASALVASLDTETTGNFNFTVTTLGGKLNVKFIRNARYSFTDIWLEGPVTFVYKGEMDFNGI